MNQMTNFQFFKKMLFALYVSMYVSSYGEHIYKISKQTSIIFN